VHEEYG